MKRFRGFTLIELLVVVSIIALLIAILLPSLARARESANKTVCGTNLSGIGKAMVIYAGQNSDDLPVALGQPWDNLMNEPGAFYSAFATNGGGAASITGNAVNIFFCPSNLNQVANITSGNTGYVFLNDRWYISNASPFNTYPTGGSALQGQVAYGPTNSLVPDPTTGLSGIYRPGRVGRPIVLSPKGNAPKYAADTELAMDEILTMNPVAPVGTSIISAGTPLKFGSLTTSSSHLSGRTSASGGNVLCLDNSVRWRPYSPKANSNVYITQTTSGPYYDVPNP